MSSLENKLQYINGTKVAIREAIQNKGVKIADGDTFRSYADKINNIDTADIIKKGTRENRIMYHKASRDKYVYSRSNMTGAYPTANFLLFSTEYTQTDNVGCVVYNRQNGKYIELDTSPFLAEYGDKVIMCFKTAGTKIYDKDFNLVASYSDVIATSLGNPKVFKNGIVWITTASYQYFINMETYELTKIATSYQATTRIMLDDTHFLQLSSSMAYLFDISTGTIVKSISGSFESGENSVNGACFQSAYGDTHYKVNNFIFGGNNTLYGWNETTKTIDTIYTGTASIQLYYTTYRINEKEQTLELLFETTYGSADNYIVCKYTEGELKIIAQYTKDQRTSRGYPSAFTDNVLFVSRGYYKGGSFVFFPDMETSTYAYYTRVVEKDNYIFMITSGGTMYVGDKYLNTIREIMSGLSMDPFEYPEHLHCYNINGAFVILCEDDRTDYCTDAGRENNGINNRIVVYCPITEIATQYHMRDSESWVGNYTTFSMNLIEFDGGCYIVPREVQYGELDGTMGDYAVRDRKVLKITCDGKSSSAELTNYRGGTRIAKGLYVLGKSWIKGDDESEESDTGVTVTDFSDPNDVLMTDFKRVNTLTDISDFDWWNQRNYILEARDNHNYYAFLFGKDPEQEVEGDEENAN
ncbi:MAG: hypothetical protein Q4C11_00080 [Clostridium sp.]|nr:hypothetical protein [Clostridium sp.]